MAQKQFKIGLSNTDKQNMAQDVYERVLALTFNEYDTTTQYEVGDFVVYNDQLYKCISATSGAWDSTKWQLATLNDLLTDIESSVVLEQKVLKDMIKRTIFSISNDENRPIYNGALLKVEDNILTIVAIDGFRLSLRKNLSNKEINNFKCIIPGKVLSELLKVLTDEENENVKIGVNKNQALFEIGQTIIISRIIEGEFLNYNSIIPESNETKIKLRTKNLLDSFERVSLFAKENKEKDKKSPVKMQIGIDGVVLSCYSDNGDAKEILSAVVEGKDIEIGFNPRYVIEALKAIEDEEIIVEFNSSISPVIIKPVVSNEFIYVVLPIKLRQE